jgi:hypothetical protein
MYSIIGQKAEEARIDEALSAVLGANGAKFVLFGEK